MLIVRLYITVIDPGVPYHPACLHNKSVDNLGFIQDPQNMIFFRVFKAVSFMHGSELCNIYMARL